MPVIHAVPIEKRLQAAPDNTQAPLSVWDFESDIPFFQAFAAAPPSSFLIEFDQPATGVDRQERVRLEKQGEFQEQTAGRLANVAEQHSNFQAFLNDNLNVDYTLRHEFFTLMNGMSIDLQSVPPTQLPHILEQIRSLPGVIKVSPLISLNQPKTVLHGTGFDALAVSPELSTAHEQTGVLNARNNLHLLGKGIKIGIIDTGIDYTHEALGGCYGPRCKVQYGSDFVDPYGSKTPGGYDCVGHGTHVAGIIAGNSTVSNFFGVAPQATLGAYRVFPCTGTSKDDIIIAALEQAYTDGMDIVNLSLGGGSSWANTALSKVAGTLASMGVVVVAAIGNDGELGLEEVSSPSINPSTISVASFEGSGYLANYFEIEGVPDIRIDYFDPDTTNAMGDTTFKVVLPDHDPEGCQQYSKSMEGNVVLIKRGSCTFVKKAEFAQQAGAVGCIFYNNVEGGLHSKSDDPSIHIFGHGITQRQGQLILDQLATSNKASININYKDKKGVFKNEMANQISIFSSWGLGPELELKPDIGAPGGYIYSTVPVNKGSFATMSGTSMATPYIAGSAALLLESEPTIDRKDVLGRLQSYAKPGLYKNTLIPDSVARQGAGMVNIFDAVRGKAFVEPTHLGLNDTLHTKGTYTIALTNHYNSAETFSLTHVPAMSVLGYTPNGQPSDKVNYNETTAEIIFSGGRSVHLESGETRLLEIQFKQPTGLNVESHWIYSGYIRMEPTLNADFPALQVPYAGMLGSYSTVDILDLEEGFPVLLGPTKEGRLMPIISRNGQALGSFPMTRNRIVTLALKISNPLRSLRVFVVDVARKSILGMAPVEGNYLGRTDSVKAKFFVMPWSGRVIDSYGEVFKLPDGDYSLMVIAPKPFSTSSDPDGAKRESWVSPVIRIRQ
ncbi:hypothetical protein BGZ99_004731 [Dissophora globulifera]|uniref:Subtilisin-like protein n=1 Tax=Dissophora globulifera TaxID=979702 RepID=A0A9P6RZ64_9FUNG|nr:hypothetical protein BGZ99_004731 [Dissophora globulifera]